MAVLHGLYWLIADRTDRGPLALLVDDAHWLDQASARFLVYLARRIESLPALLVVAVRRGAVAGPATALPEQAALVLAPRPLSEAGSGELVRQELGPRADEELCRSCHDATGGNPFYLRELVADLKSEGRRPTVEVARSVRSLGAGTVGRSVLVRIGRLGLDCDHLAEALAILGPGAPLRHAASLAELNREAAETAADRLRAADVLAPERELDFVHPIVHEALLAELPASRRAALHSGAAALLVADGAPPDRIAAHLLSAEPYGESWVVEALRAAARQAMARGAPDTAAGYLRRGAGRAARARGPPGGAARARPRRGAAADRSTSSRPCARRSSWRATRRSAPGWPRSSRRRCSAWGEATRCSELVAHMLDELRTPGPQLVERLEAHLLGGGATDLTATRRVIERMAAMVRARARQRRDRSVDARRAGLDGRRHRPVGPRGVGAGAAGAA